MNRPTKPPELQLVTPVLAPSTDAPKPTLETMAGPDRSGASGDAPSLPPLESPGDFDWLNSDSVILREQPETAIYRNPYGALVIRQRAGWNDTEDPFVFICPQNIDEFLDKLTDLCGVPSVGKPGGGGH